MGPYTKQLKNSEGVEMALRIAKAALCEASSLALLGLTALIADELKKRCMAEIKRKFHSQGTRQTG